MSYLTRDDIHTMCDNIIDGVDMVDAEIASDLVDGFLGVSYKPSSRRDRVSLRHNRGKLSYSPVLEITSVKGYTTSIFGRTVTELRPEDIDLDPENDGYFTYIGDYGLNHLITRAIPKSIEVEYVSGFETYPRRLKTAVAMLACNIREAKSFAGAKQMTSLDFQVLMSDDSFFTSDIKMLLKGLGAE